MSTVVRHRRLVRRFCFKCGLYRQGLVHDLSKFSPCEFIVGVRYYTGNCSPNDLERKEIGYSSAWLHHKGRNRHHLEYWTDYKKDVGIIPIEMPLKYTAEMCCDRIAACRIYNGEKYRQGDAYEYFIQSKLAPQLMHFSTWEKLHEWLSAVRDEGEERAFLMIKKELREDKKRKNNGNIRKVEIKAE